MMETPNNPEVVPSQLLVSPEEVFAKVHEQKFTSFKTAADYLLVNNYHTELQMSVNPFSFETPE